MRSALALATLAVLVFAPIVRAEDPQAAPTAFSSTDDFLKKRGTVASGLVVVAKDDSEQSKTVLKLLSDPKLAKFVKDGIAVSRIDPNDENESKKLGVPVEKAECVLAFDGYIVFSAKHTKAITADTLTSLLKPASDATTKKKAREKTLDKAVAAAEKAIAAKDPKTASTQLLAVVAEKPNVPCKAVETAEKHIAELTLKANEILSEARKAVDKPDFSKAHKLLSEVMDQYPIPAVLDEAKSVSSALGSAERAASGK